MTVGTYTLLVHRSRPATVEFGAAGERDLDAGWYAYTGSAFGPGGFARIDRHRAVAAGENETRHWHVDYLLGDPAAAIADDRRLPGVDAECAVSRAIAERAEPVDGLGATDCACRAHLAFASRRSALVDAIEAAHAAARSGDDPTAPDHPG